MLTEKRLLELGFEYATKMHGFAAETIGPQAGYFHPKLGTIYLTRHSSSMPFLVKTLEGSQLTSVKSRTQLLMLYFVITGENLSGSSFEIYD